jgi:hypothetical protein
MESFPEALAKTDGPEPQLGQLGELSSWLYFCDLPLKTGPLAVCDPSFGPGDGVMSVSLNLPPGTYRIEGRVVAYGGERRVAAMRCVVRGSTSLERGSQVGECGVDTGRVGFCDEGVFGPAMDRYEDEYMEQLDSVEDPCAAVVLGPAREAMIALADCGFGDGSYPVFELCSDGKVVGLEIEFIGPEKRYPFNRTAEDETDTGSEATDRPDHLGEMLKELVAAAKRKTGDPVKDKEMLKTAAAEILKKKETELRDQIAPLTQHLIEQRRQAPAIRIRLAPDDGDWFYALKESRARAAVIEGAGYTLHGLYQYQNLPAFFSAIYFHADGSTAQIHYGTKGHTVELVSRFGGDQVYSVIDTAASPGVPVPPWQKCERFPETTPSELIAKFRAGRPPVSPALTPENILDFLAETFARLQDWRIARGGWNREEIQQQLRIEDPVRGKDQIDDAVMNVREKWLFAWFKRMVGGLAEKLFESLIIIHDDHEPFMLFSIWVNAGGNPKVRQARFEGADGRTAFAEVNEAEGAPLLLVAKKSEGFPADFYLPKTEASSLSIGNVMAE